MKSSNILILPSILSARMGHLAEDCRRAMEAGIGPVAVATDGLHSLVSAETGSRLDALSVAQELLGFGEANDGFIKRRLRQVLIEYGRQGVFNFDDLSLGVFVKAT